MERFHWNEALVGLSLGIVGLLTAIVQGGLVRIINPKLGPVKSIYTGLIFYGIGLIMIALVPEGWMLFLIMIPYCMGGIANPAVHGMISNEVPSNEQGGLQGALTSLMSITSILGPILMTGLFSHFTDKHNTIYFPGAPFIMGAILVILSFLLAIRTLSSLEFNTQKV